MKPGRDFRIADLIVRDDEQEALQALLRPSDLILGVDGHVHYGEARRFKGGAVLRGVICGVLPMRAIGPRERWWTTEPSRVCAECGTDRVEAWAHPTAQQLRALRAIHRQQMGGEDGHDAEGDLSMCSRNWPATHHALVRRGLVVATYEGLDEPWSPWTYRLTDAGRAAIGATDVPPYLSGEAA